MKKVNLSGKLSLKKETIAKLNGEQMSGIVGGSLSVHSNCNTCIPAQCIATAGYTGCDACNQTAASGCC